MEWVQWDWRKPRGMVGLVAVGAQQFGVRERLVVGDQGEAAVGGGVVGDLLLVHSEGEREDRLLGLAVARLGAGAAALLLAEALLGALGHVVGDPALRAGAGQGVLGGLVGGGKRPQA